MPRLVIRLSALRHNLQVIRQQCLTAGADILFVFKEAALHPQLTRLILKNSDVHSLGIVAWPSNPLPDILGISLHHIYSPAPELMPQAAACSEIILSTEQALYLLARQPQHGKVRLMLEAGDGRDGILPEELTSLCKAARNLHLELSGLAVNFSCMSSDPPDEKHLCYAVRQLNCMKAFYPHADISVGGTDVLELTAKFSLPESIREIRCGTGIMLGVYPLSGKNIPAARQDTFRLETHVLECRKKQGRMRALLDMGSYHTAPDKLIPALPGITLAGVSSAYTSLDITECPLRIREGDILTFHLRYEALARSLCSRALPLILEDYKEETAHG